MSRRGSERSGKSRRGTSSRHQLNKSERDHRSRQLNPEDRLYTRLRGESNIQNSEKDWRSLMDEVAASRIQSHADRTGLNQDFKARAQSSASKNKQ